MNVQFLASLIKSNQRVVVPSLGAFLHKENGVVVFSPFLNKDDGLLLGAICRHYGLSASSAQLELDGLVSEIRLAMTQVGKFYIDSVGILILNENGGMSLVEEGVVNNGIGGGSTTEGRVERKVGVESAQDIIPSIDPLLSRASSVRGAVGQPQMAISQSAAPVEQPSYGQMPQRSVPEQSSQPSQQFAQANQVPQSAAPVEQPSYGQMPQRSVPEQSSQPTQQFAQANQVPQSAAPVEQPSYGQMPQRSVPEQSSQPSQQFAQANQVPQSINHSQPTMPRAVGGVQSSGYSAPVSQIGRPVQPSWVPPIQPSNKGVPQVQAQSQPRVSQPSTQDQTRVQLPQNQTNSPQRPYGTPQQTRPQVAPQRSPMAGSQPSPQFAQGTQSQPVTQGSQPRPKAPQTPQNQPGNPTHGSQPQGLQNNPQNRMPNGRPAPQGARPTQGKPNRTPQKPRPPQKGGRNKVDMWLLVAIVAAILVVILIIYGLIYTDPVSQIF